MIKNTKKQRLKIWGRGETLKKEVLKRQNKSITKIIKKKKIYIYIYEICFKNRVFFCWVIVDYKN